MIMHVKPCLIPKFLTKSLLMTLFCLLINMLLFYVQVNRLCSLKDVFMGGIQPVFKVTTQFLILVEHSTTALTALPTLDLVLKGKFHIQNKNVSCD